MREQSKEELVFLSNNAVMAHKETALCAEKARVLDAALLLQVDFKAKEEEREISSLYREIRCAWELLETYGLIQCKTCGAIMPRGAHFHRAVEETQRA